MIHITDKIRGVICQCVVEHNHVLIKRILSLFEKP
jgi:hypothetical protein